ncbi:MAG TPA: glycogen debranching N-terminal domain-containing protein, partial [Planctomycetaceae bacterium]|nr:glycogen debranching N-terminal domain-containing protein [Planctomycetaceae bacterium]
MDGSERTLNPREPGQGGQSAEGGSLPRGSNAEGPSAVAPADGSAFRILAASSLADERTRVLKHGDTFGVFDHYGDIKPEGLGEEGLFHDGT